MPKIAVWNKSVVNIRFAFCQCLTFDICLLWPLHVGKIHSFIQKIFLQCLYSDMCSLTIFNAILRQFQNLTLKSETYWCMWFRQSHTLQDSHSCSCLGCSHILPDHIFLGFLRIHQYLSGEKKNKIVGNKWIYIVNSFSHHSH